ncbi:MAG: alanyl-tRNA editing protein [Bryobacterales bacterium]|nr:alanyl-tRNA editing protein [Bryobacterales bacterium]
MQTERLYYNDCYLTSFLATVAGIGDDGAILLDRSAFYPESGGQSHDLGTLHGCPVERVIERGEEVLHYLAEPHAVADLWPPFKAGETVSGEIDWERRFDLMQHHTGQHLLSAVAEDLYGWRTEAVHMGVTNATVEFSAGPDCENLFHAEAIPALEEEANRWIEKNLSVVIAMHDAAQGLELRKATERTGSLRIVSIGDLDRSACGGTHVRATGEIGCLFLGRQEKIRGNLRVEFVCGLRAVREARRQRSWLSEAAAVFHAAPERVAALAEAQRVELGVASKRLRAFESKQSEEDGKEARRSLGEAGADVHCAVRWVESIGDIERSFSRGFCAEAAPLPNRSILLTIARGSTAFLLEASPDAGFDAKAWVKNAASAFGVQGGGKELSVSGRLPDLDCAHALITQLPSRAVELGSE